MNHNCNAYCHPPEHCDLVYTDGRTQSGHIAQAYGWNYGLQVTRTEPAREAPEIETYRSRDLDMMAGAVPSSAQKWLVYWK